MSAEVVETSFNDSGNRFKLLKVEKYGIYAELPAKLAKFIMEMDKMTFAEAYQKKDKFHEETIREVGHEPNSDYMKEQIDNFFEIEKRRRGILEIGGNL